MTAHRERARVVAQLEMSLTPAELHRLGALLPGADRIRLDPMSISYEEPAGRAWTITLSNPRERRFGRLSLPVADVAIALTGYSPAEAERFLEQFHLVFRKGGG